VNTYLLFSRFRLIRGEWSEKFYQDELQLVRESLEKMVGDATSPLKGEHWKRYLAAAPAFHR
jgi:hypothetical protein